MSTRFKLYNVNIKYIRNLHRIDDNVPSVSPQIGKQMRPFLGIVVLINGSSVIINSFTYLYFGIVLFISLIFSHNFA